MIQDAIRHFVEERFNHAVLRQDTPWSGLQEQAGGEADQIKSLYQWGKTPEGRKAMKAGYVDLSVIAEPQGWRGHALSELVTLLSGIMYQSKTGGAMIRDPNGALQAAHVSANALAQALKVEFASDWSSAAEESLAAGAEEEAAALQRAAGAAKTMRVQVTPVKDGWEIVTSPTIPDLMQGLGEAKIEAKTQLQETGMDRAQDTVSKEGVARSLAQTMISCSSKTLQKWVNYQEFKPELEKLLVKHIKL